VGLADGRPGGGGRVDPPARSHRRGDRQRAGRQRREATGDRRLSQPWTETIIHRYYIYHLVLASEPDSGTTAAREEDQCLVMSWISSTSSRPGLVGWSPWTVWRSRSSMSKASSTRC